MNKQTEERLKMFVAIVSLFGLLMYTWVHTSALLARYVQPPFVAYVAAFSVETAIAGMTWRLARKQARSSFLLFALIAALTISAGANIMEGYAERYGEGLTMANLGNIDPVQAVMGLAATGLLSLMVFAISEIIGSDVARVTRQTERKQRSEQAALVTEQVVEQPEQPSEPVDYKIGVYLLKTNRPELGVTAIANELGCSKATASKWSKAYEQEANAEQTIAVSTASQNGNGTVQ
jgi:hypothetical protein